MFLIDRKELISALQAVSAHGWHQVETRRRQRLSDDLERTRQDVRARKVKLPVAPNPAPGASLPSGMRLVGPGVLEGGVYVCRGPAGEVM
jgi:hypothetical protein